MKNHDRPPRLPGCGCAVIAIVLLTTLLVCLISLIVTEHGGCAPNCYITEH